MTSHQTQEYKQFFIEWFSTFTPETNQWLRDKSLHITKEDSPWHREDNVWVHTQMVIDEYMKIAPAVWTREDLCGAIALAFHDVGKPISKEVVTKPDGTSYNRFKGHEQASSWMWRDYITTHDEFDWLGKNGVFYNVALMIERHLPYDLSNQKLLNLVATLRRFELDQVFKNVLLADARGRISDDHETKLARVADWIRQYDALEIQGTSKYSDRMVTFMIGPSGSGKTTYKQREYPTAVSYSLDELRLKWYADGISKEDYNTAFRASVDDSSFETKAQKYFIELLKTETPHIVIDNTNLSTKRRKGLISLARQHGYSTDAIVFLVPKQTLLDRQRTRDDKELTEGAVNQQFASMTLPIYGDFDFITIVNS